MIELKYLEKPTRIPLAYLCDTVNERRFVTTEEIRVQLSSGYWLTIEKGFETDLSSVPQWLWSFCSPIDHGFIGDLIHDKLWTEKQPQLERFSWNIFTARKFADDERHRWRRSLVPKKWLKNIVTHRILRWFGGFYYSRQWSIPD